MNIDATIISALIATFTAIVISIISNDLSKKNTLKFEERKLKQQYYIEYIQALSENIITLIIIASPKVVAALYEYNNLQINHLKYHNVENYPEKFTCALTKIVQTIRVDLYGNKKHINGGLPDIYFLSGILKVNRMADNNL